MWQELLVYVIVAVAAGAVFWKFYKKFTGKSSCCGGDCSCSDGCASSGGGKGCCAEDGGLKMAPGPGTGARKPG